MRDHVAFYCDHHRGFFVDKRSGDLFRLNSVGVLIFKALKKGDSPAAIVSQICREFSVESAEAESDFNAFVERLRDQEIIR